MNTQILQKCLDELKKDTPNISYVQGILETFITLAGNTPIINETPINNTLVVSATPEEEIPEFLKPGPIGRINS